MIPYALLNGTINNQEVRITDLSVFHFLFRVPEEIKNIESIILYFYNGKNYNDLCLDNYSFFLEEKNEFFYVYRVETEEAEYANQVRMLMEHVQVYTKYKEQDQQERITRYPLELDSIYPHAYQDFIKEMFQDLKPNSRYDEELSTKKMGICLENPIVIENFQTMDLAAFQDWYFEQAHLSNHPLHNASIKYMYIGNQFCEHLFPDEKILSDLLIKCEKWNLQPVLMFAPLKEHRIPHVKRILDGIDSSIEIVVNDLGMLELVKEYGNPIRFGVLLNKHIKDSRLKYVDIQNKEQTDLNISYFQELGVQAFSYESCEYGMDIQASTDYYFPKYQINTSGKCTMFAMCKNGNRALQEEVFFCPKYCLYQYFLYPKHLHTIGQYNSIFGYDLRILQDEDYLESIRADRMIVTI